VSAPLISYPIHEVSYAKETFNPDGGGPACPCFGISRHQRGHRMDYHRMMQGHNAQESVRLFESDRVLFGHPVYAAEASYASASGRSPGGLFG
jgi:hypothetical protein